MSTQASSALEWDSIRWAHSQGCAWYDMGGAPNAGIAQFKRSYRPEIRSHPVGSWTLYGLAALRRLSQVRHHPDETALSGRARL